MSGETQSHSRKRRERKKKKDSDLDRMDPKNSPDMYDEDDSCKDDPDEHGANGKSHHDDHSHGPSSSTVSTVVFFLLLGGLVILTTLIFLELKDSKEVGPPISESRYASILGDFVDEHAHEEDDHDVPQMYTEDEHEHEEDQGGGGGEEVEVDEQIESISGRLDEAEAEPPLVDIEEERTVEDVIDESTQSTSEDSTPELSNEEVGAEPEEETDLKEHGDNAEAEQENENDEPQVEQESENEEPEDVRVEQEIEDEEPQDVHVEQEAEIEEPQDVQVEQEMEYEEAEEQKSSHGEQESESDSADVRLGEEHLAEEQIEIEPAPAIEEQPPEEVDVQGEVRDSPSLHQSNENREDESTAQDDLTDPYDYEFQEELDAADAQLENCRSAEQTAQAKALYEDVLRRHPASPRALHGIARSYDKLSEQQNSNALLEQSIRAYQEVLRSPRATDALFRLAAERCVDRMRFRGFIEKATGVQAALIRRFPRDASLRNQLAVSHLLLGQPQTAKKILEEVLGDFPTDGFAKVHLGFILKTDENNNRDAIRYLQEGIESEEPGTIDGRFYFHLGDALTREGLAEKALTVYQEGVRRGLFLSAYQRSLYNVHGLTGRPWWTAEESTYGKHLKRLEDNWWTIRDEGLALLDETRGGFLPETENLRDTGTWKQFEMYSRGKKIAANCAKAPRTCELIASIPDAAGCKRGQAKFSIMHPGTHVWPHTGPTNCRIRAHLGLVVPSGVKIRVANETRSWSEGKFIVFDDSFEHEVWHAGEGIRLVLIVDLWHPELTRHQKETLTSI